MTSNSSNGKKTEECENNTAVFAADFETAIASTGFGYFNIALLLAVFPSAMATIFETSALSYVLPSAECELKLSLIDKGALYSMTYAGTITASFLWGYLADSKGRKQILIYGNLAETICVLAAATSQNTTQLLIFKFLGGFVICGPFAVIVSYLTEFHGKKYRSRIMMSVGIMFTSTTFIMPVMALLILPLSFDINIAGLRFNSWRLYIAVSALPSLLSGLLFTRLPESPKFLMSLGRNAEALEIFQKVFVRNTGKKSEDFEIKTLESDLTSTASTVKLNFAAKLRATRKQLAPLFRKPYLGLSLQVYLITFSILVGQSTIILWLPQLFATISEIELSSALPPSMCAIIEYSVNKTTLLEQNTTLDLCEIPVSISSYTNNMITAMASIIGYLIAMYMVARIGEKWVLVISSFIAGLSGFAMYWSGSSLTTLITSSVFVANGNIAISTIVTASVNLFPTLLRTIVVSQSSMFGRCGSLLGNLCFPIFMTLGCIPPFVLVSLLMFLAGLLAFFLPQTKNASLK